MSLLEDSIEIRVVTVFLISGKTVEEINDFHLDPDDSDEFYTADENATTDGQDK